MSIIVNTNMSALNIQQNLATAGDAMKVAMQRMATGSKINQASDDAAGMAVSTNFETQISGQKVAQQNAQLGSNLLTTTEGTVGVVQKNVQRIRDLIEQASNGTYDQKAKTAIRTEIASRTAEVSRLNDSANFNGIRLFGDTGTTGTGTVGVKLQVGDGADATTNAITIDKSVFASVNVSTMAGTTSAFSQTNLDTFLGSADGSTAATSTDASTLLKACDNALSSLVSKKTSIGAYQNRLTSAVDGLKVSQLNLASANSTIKDSDIAEESASYVKNQILQQASASLLAQANQAPSIAINLI